METCVSNKNRKGYDIFILEEEFFGETNNNTNQNVGYLYSIMEHGKVV